MSERRVKLGYLKGIIIAAFFLSLSIIISESSARAGINQWTSAGPAGGLISAIAIAPANSQTVFAGTANGVYKSTNGGTSWSAVNNGLTSISILSLAIDPANSQTVYAGAASGGVFKTTDGGATWNSVTENIGVTIFTVRSLAIDPTNSQTIYAGTESSGVFKSTNGGGSWIAINGGLTSTSVYALAIDPTNSQTIYAGTYSGAGGIFKSTNGGISWNPVNNGLTSTSFRALIIDPINTQTIYAGSYGGGVFKSTTGGTSWGAVSIGLTIPYLYSLAVDPANTQVIYAGTYDGLFKTSNGGTSWGTVNSGLTGSSSTCVNALAVDHANGQTVYAGTTVTGIFKTTTGGGSWSAVNNGISSTTVLTLDIDPSNSQVIYAGVNAAGIFKTSDGGTSWSAVNNGLVYPYVNSLAVDPQNGQNVYAGTMGGMYKTANGGSSWSAINSGFPNTSVLSLAIDPANSQIVYAGTGGGVYKTSTGGSSWSAANGGLTMSNVRSLVIDPANSQIIYAGTDGGVFKTVNGGTSWGTVNSGLTSAYVYALAIDPTSSQTIYAGTTNGGAFKSTNGGTSWNAASTGLNSYGYVFSLAVDPLNPANVYAGTNAGVFRSTNGGGSWSDFNSGLPLSFINVLKVRATNPSVILAGTTGAGVLSNTYYSNLRLLQVASVNPSSGASITVTPSDYSNNSSGISRFLRVYPDGTSVTLTAPASAGGNPFSGWKGCDSVNGNICTVSMSSDRTITAAFGMKSLTVASVNPATGAAISLSPADFYGNSNGSTRFTRVYAPGTAISLTAPASMGGVIFSGWSGCDSANSTGCLVTMNDNRTVTATYGMNVLTVASETPNSGVTISVSPADSIGNTDGATTIKRFYYGGTTVTLDAPPSVGGNYFNAWKGCDSVTLNQCVVTVTANKTVTASYLPPKVLSVTAANVTGSVSITVDRTDLSGAGSGNTTFIRTYRQGEYVTLTAPAASAGYSFNFWSGCDYSTGTQCGMLINSDKTATANYYKDTPVTPVAQLPKTGQTLCFDTNGIQIDCSGTGQDGELQQGVPWPDPRFTDNLDGTITDNLTGLVWLKDANCFGGLNWATAVATASSLASGSCALTDGSKAGDWRLPNINEMESLINIGQTYGNYSPWLLSAGFINVGRNYWSSTGTGYGAWTADFLYGSVVTPGNAGFAWGVWPVRTAPSNGAIRLPKTGQTQSYTPGDDGALQKGADACPRFVYRNDTYSDRVTGLMWPRNANLMISQDQSFDQDGINDGSVVWQHALDYVTKLNADHYQGFIDWRLPNRRELMSLVNRGQANLPGWLLSIGFANLSGTYWSSSYGGSLFWAWVEPFNNGNGEPYDDPKTNYRYVWPVRTGMVEDPGQLTDLSITGGPATVPTSSSARYVTTALWGDGSTTPETATWSVTPTTYASINSSTGILTTQTLGAGTTITVTASYTSCGVTKTASKIVSITSDPAVLGIAIIGPDSINENSSVPFTAVKWNSSSLSTVTPTWSITPTTYASINSSTGMLTALAVPSDQTVIIKASYTSGNVTHMTSRVVTIVNQSSALTVHITGAGSGSVNSIPSGAIACSNPPLTGTCSTDQAASTTLTLAATPSSDSLFSGWSGACTKSVGNCNVLFDANKSLTATFTPAPLARILTTPYNTLLAAYNAAANSGSVIMLKEGDPGSALGTLDANLGKSVTLRGGYNATYQTNSGSTLILGPVIMGSGTVILDNVEVR
jgi:photosystem II stability/assembly factor-like uncharacterized protein